ncbi:MAG: NlpC/P60 family protein [Verrucomicrobiota bacterium]|nr:NlpC/P60 family protein [Verrucomicrobiota bacterium]
MISTPTKRALAALTAGALLLGGGVRFASAEESLGTKIKNLFEPTPPPKKHRNPAKKSSPTPTPSPKKGASPEPSPAKKPTPSPIAEVSETPKPKRKSSPSPSPAGKHKKTGSPTPSITPSPSPSATPEASPSPADTPSPSATPVPKKSLAPGATVLPNDINGIDNYSPAVRKVVDTALGLTTRNLEYKYGSADPSAGGMDCSGFVYYVLTQNGVKDVPRDASGQYAWLRKAGKFQAVISRNDSTFELEDLKPGDLLFWTGTYSVEKDPPITHTMIYLGREKKTSQRIMAGASDGRVYHGESRYGVGVFDFKVSGSAAPREGRTPTFVGYGRIPGLGDG